MGLDAVEFIMEIEEEFGISIADDEYIRFCTLGQFHDYLLVKCESRERPTYSIRSAFYRLRHAMGVAWSVESRSLRPSTLVLPLLGPWRRHRKWNRLKRELALELPLLESRAGVGVFWGLLVCGLGGLLVGTILVGDLFVGLAAALMGLLPGVLLGYAVGVFWPPTVGPACRTAGGLTRELISLNDREFRVSAPPATENDPTWERLCDVLVRQCGARREVLNRETRFAEDLGF